MSDDTKVRKGTCFCGAVEISVAGEPSVMGYCHCQSCRQWSGGPVTAFTLWPPEAVRITKGADKLGAYQKSETTIRRWCTVCGGHVLSEHPLWGITDVFAAILPDLAFEPTVHVNYADTVLPIRDGLPKQKDFPAEAGGSGVLLPE